MIALGSKGVLLVAELGLLKECELKLRSSVVWCFSIGILATAETADEHSFGVVFDDESAVDWGRARELPFSLCASHRRVNKTLSFLPHRVRS